MKTPVALLATAFIAAACSQTNSSGSSMSTVGYAFAPPAANAFCASQPRLCSTAGSARTATLTEARMEELKQVTASVNSSIRQREDAETVGREDDWRLPTTGVGDCEDLAILKKNELRKRGWPASTLLLTVATYRGIGHTVLTVRTDKGDFILDNLNNSVKNWSRTPYRYFARQSQSETGRWMRIGA